MLDKFLFSHKEKKELYDNYSKIIACSILF